MDSDQSVSYFNAFRAELTGVPIQFAYVPSHLHHMCFEIFKNSMRATVEKFKDGEMAKLEVLVSKTDADITIRLLDFGGGIPRSQMGNLFKYMYTTAGMVGKAHADAVNASSTPPLAGLGYGLPLSRFYARYSGLFPIKFNLIQPVKIFPWRSRHILHARFRY